MSVPTTISTSPTGRAQSPGGFVTYEQLLDQDTRWALNEGSLFFEEKGAVHESLRRITKKLEELGIPYAVAGGMALFAHGYRRFTEDVDILVTHESLKRIHDELEGRGYVRPFEKSKNLRDTVSKVKIEFLVAGGYPGDGKPKDISFPDPSNVFEIRKGYHVLNLPQLISLKLASGLTGEGRTKDLADVEELIKSLHLPVSLSNELHPYVQPSYLDIWQRLHQSQKRYILLWRNKWLTAEAKSIDEMIASFQAATEELKAMRDAGVTLDSAGGISDDYAQLVTNDPDVAHRFGMEDESEYMDLDDSPPHH